MKTFYIIILGIFSLVSCGAPVTAIDDDVTKAFKRLTKFSQWNLTNTIKLDFNAFHTQGLVKIDDYFFVSGVEIIKHVEIYGESDYLWDFSPTRTVGEGRGWLFKFDQLGALVDKVELTHGDAYHPGGIDYDGDYIWAPVSEYRPNSSTSVYRIDPNTMEAVHSFDVKDHIGNILYNTDRGTFHGSSWGARRLYQWHIEFDSKGTGEVKEQTWHANPAHYIDYQDCHYQATNYMLCAGVQKINTPLGEAEIGGVELVDISKYVSKPAHLLPVTEYIDDEMVVTNNPYWVELDGDIMRFYFMPNNKRNADLLVYELNVLKAE